MSDSPPSNSYNGLRIVSFWRLFTLRHARAEWLQSILLVALLGLGVGTFLSIRMANRAAVEGFELFTTSVRGSTDWIVEVPGRGISFEELTRLRDALGSEPAELFPIYETTIVAQLSGGAVLPTQTIRLLGMDLVQLRDSFPEASDFPEFSADANFWPLLDDDQHLLLSTQMASRMQVDVGQQLDVVLNGETVPFVVRGILPSHRGAIPLPDNLAIADLGALERRLGLNTVSRVEVVISEGGQFGERMATARDRMIDRMGEGWTVSQPQEQQLQGVAMTAAFRLNLTVLSLIALLVGLYLITQALDATVSRRRKEIAVLRSLGIEARSIKRLWLSEGLIYGLAASAAGLLFGWLLAHITVDAVSTTIRALYRDTAATAVAPNRVDVLLAAALGIGGSLIAAWLPARDAAATPPAQFLRIGKRIPPFALFAYPSIGYAMLVAGFACTFLPPLALSPNNPVPVAGYLTAFLWLIGGTIAAADTIRWQGILARRCFSDSPPIVLAASRIAAPTSRHQLALAGFFVAIGMAASMTYLINSFEHTVTSWLKSRLNGDLYLSSIGFQGAQSDPRIHAQLLDQIASLDGVASVRRYRSFETEINGGRAYIAGTELQDDEFRKGFLWRDAPADHAPQDFAAEAIGYATESLANRRNLRQGDFVSVQTPSGMQRVRVAGIYSDYARDSGILLVDLTTLSEWYPISEYDTATVFAQPDVDVASLQLNLRQRFAGLNVRDNPELMATALGIFNQTFAVTRALQLIGIGVALAGLVLSLISLLRESTIELAIQRNLGMSRRQIAHSTACEGLGIAIAGLLGGLLLSGALGWLLIHVINRQSFGWTLQSSYPWNAAASMAAAVILLAWSVSFLTGALFLRRKRFSLS